MANEDNLKKGEPYQFRSGEEAAAAGRKGGQKSGESRRRKRTMKAAVKILMDMPVPESQAKKMKAYGIEEEDATYQMALLIKMMQEGLGGSVKAAAFLRDTMGENPIDEQRRVEARQRKREADQRLAFDREQFEYKKQQDAGENVEYEDLEDVEAEIYGHEDSDEDQL